MEGCLVCNTGHLGRGKDCLGNKGARAGGVRRVAARGPPGNAGHLSGDVNPQGDVADAGQCHTDVHQDDTGICVDDHGPPSH